MKESLENTFIKNWSSTVKNHIYNTSILLEKIKPIHLEKGSNHSKKLNKGFNIFEIISDTYYKENFHSQVISQIISPRYHKNGNKLLIEFIKCLNLISKIKIDINDFQNPVVDNEKDKIDIRIRDSYSKKSIIIENKINDAIDQYKQIPRYLENEKNAEFEVIAIVYLTLVKDKMPSQKNWTASEKEEISNLLILLPAYSESEINLCKNWITPSIESLNHVDIISTLRQYQKIITNLSLKKMDNFIVGKFYSQIQNEEDYNTALSVKSMLGELCEYRAKKLYEQFATIGYTMFESVTPFPWKGTWRTKFENYCSQEKIDLCFEVVYHEEKSVICIWERDKTRKENDDKIFPLLEKLGIQNSFNKQSNFLYSKDFPFPKDEKELYLESELILKKLSEIK